MTATIHHLFGAAPTTPRATTAQLGVEHLVALRDALPRIPAKSRDFAESLLAQSEHRGLSDKQMFWVRKLVADAAPATPPAAPAASSIGDLAAIQELFARARTHLRFPKVRLQLEDGRPIVLSVAGAKAKHPGAINVTDGGTFGNNTWYGRVALDGSWHPGRDCDDATRAAIFALLQAFASDPAAVAAAYGKLVGSCCFCARTLTDRRSTEVGYGPICAGHYDLPWGE